MRLASTQLFTVSGITADTRIFSPIARPTPADPSQLNLAPEHLRSEMVKTERPLAVGREQTAEIEREQAISR